MHNPVGKIKNKKNYCNENSWYQDKNRKDFIRQNAD